MTSRQKWEYRVQRAPAITPESVVTEFNELGLEGWELVSAVGVGELGAIEEIWYVFKRGRVNPRVSNE